MRMLFLVPICAVALAVRCVYLWDEVFADGLVRFGGADPWLHMRQIEYLVANFPQHLTHDPYALHPTGQSTVVGPFLDYLVAIVALIAGLGSPSPRTVELVGAWTPAVLGALLPVPVFLLTRRLAGAAAGWVAAGLVAIMPGQILTRTSLGFTDHHVLETLLVAWLVFALVRALDRAEASGASFADLRSGSRAALRGPAVAGAVAGVVLWAYLATWVGGGIVLLLLAAWLVVQVHVAHLRGERSDHLALVCVPAFGTALVVVLLTLGGVPRVGLHVQGLVVLLVLALALPAVSARITARGVARWWMPLVVAVLGAVALGGLHAARPGFLGGVLNQLSWFRSRGLQFTVGEAQPLLMVLDEVSWGRAWHFFGAGLAFAPVALALFVARVLRSGRPAWSLVLVWSAAMLLITFGQNRFAYYASVNVAVMAGVVFGPVLAWAWEEAESGALAGLARQVLLPLAVLAVLFGPPVPETLAIAGATRTVTPEWQAALEWMREETPEPFGDPAHFRSPDLGRRPGRESEYGVLSWWESGYWITRVARRVPVANPSQSGARTAARLLLGGDPEAVVAELEERRIRYVVVGSELMLWNPLEGPVVLGQALDVAGWADLERSDLYELYTFSDGDRSRDVPLFYPAYYRSLLFRLTVLGGEGSAAGPTPAVVVFERDERDGREIRRVTAYQVFPDEAAALEFAAAQAPGTARLVGRDPFASCVPLGPIPRLREVYRSPESLVALDEREIPYLRVFALPVNY